MPASQPHCRVAWRAAANAGHTRSGRNPCPLHANCRCLATNSSCTELQANSNPNLSTSFMLYDCTACCHAILPHRTTVLQTSTAVQYGQLWYKKRQSTAHNCLHNVICQTIQSMKRPRPPNSIPQAPTQHTHLRQQGKTQTVCLPATGTSHCAQMTQHADAQQHADTDTYVQATAYMCMLSDLARSSYCAQTTNCMPTQTNTAVCVLTRASCQAC